MAFRILDCVQDPGPCPEVPSAEEPSDFAERLKWRRQMVAYSKWIDKRRRFVLAEKVRLLEAIPEEKRTLVESIVFLMAMNVMANDLAAESDIFSILRE